LTSQTWYPMKQPRRFFFHRAKDFICKVRDSYSIVAISREDIMKTLKPAVTEESRQFHSFKKDDKKTNTTFKRKTGVSLLVIFVMFCEF